MCLNKSVTRVLINQRIPKPLSRYITLEKKNLLVVTSVVIVFEQHFHVKSWKGLAEHYGNLI